MTAPRRFTELAAAAAAARLPALLGALHAAWYDDGEIVDIPVYERYGDRDRGRRGAVPRLPARVPARRAAGVRRARARSSERRGRVPRTSSRPDGRASASRPSLLAAVTLRGLGASRRATVGALALVAAFPLLLGSVVLTRFDLWPAALVAAALAALVHGRDRLGFGLLGAAVAAKLYPAVLVPLALAYVWRRRGRREALVCLGVCAGVVVLAFLPFLVARAGRRRAQHRAAARRGRCRSRASARRSTSPRTSSSGSTSRCARATARRT